MFVALPTVTRPPVGGDCAGAVVGTRCTASPVLRESAIRGARRVILILPVHSQPIGAPKAEPIAKHPLAVKARMGSTLCLRPFLTCGGYGSFSTSSAIKPDGAIAAPNA
ncbi:hypothetical protein RHSP_82493 [Rhizobium freirei PRF 81]|uniref:Uncharacterized protein n=1 Tax=Rhizobium freirei PRF 81 TaxID=363754 RepID=N6UV88_9HYPH|nr:hypothetical protein RHSP_82493 [Rhizobium freirei PRF 81]